MCGDTQVHPNITKTGPTGMESQLQVSHTYQKCITPVI